MAVHDTVIVLGSDGQGLPAIRRGGNSVIEFDSGIKINASSFATADILFSSLTSAGNDPALVRDANNTLGLRNATAAQTFNVYNTFTDASNYERATLKWSGNVLSIGSEQAGSGSGRDVNFLRAGTAILRLTNGFVQIDGSTPLVWTTDNVGDIGQSGANRPRDLFLSRDCYTANATFLLRTKATLTDGAAANTATLTNAPAAGNPTKWISIDDNGTTRRIPAW